MSRSHPSFDPVAAHCDFAKLLIDVEADITAAHNDALVFTGDRHGQNLREPGAGVETDGSAMSARALASGEIGGAFLVPFGGYGYGSQPLQ